MSARCSYARCGSFGLNIAPASGLCDAHFYKVQRDELLAALKDLRDAINDGHEPALGQANNAIHKSTGGAV